MEVFIDALTGCFGGICGDAEDVGFVTFERGGREGCALPAGCDAVIGFWELMAFTGVFVGVETFEFGFDLFGNGGCALAAGCDGVIGLEIEPN